MIDIGRETESGLISEEVLNAWNTLLAAAAENNGQLDPQALAGFVSEHFEQPGGELEDYEPTDFNAAVGFLGGIN